MTDDINRKQCIWDQDGEDSDCWVTVCGEAYCLTSGTPSENNMRFCCFCGKPLEESPHSTEDEDNE